MEKFNQVIAHTMFMNSLSGTYCVVAAVCVVAWMVRLAAKEGRISTEIKLALIGATPIPVFMLVQLWWRY